MWLCKEQPNGSVDPPATEGFLFSDSIIDANTIQAYRETHYHVQGAEQFTLQVDMPSDELTQLYRSSRADCATFVTACNPLGVDVGHEANAKLHNILRETLSHRSLKYVSGVGKHPSGNWPEESSYLVLGLSLESAKTLGRQLEQNAIIWIGSDRVPQLVLLR
jgi:hypothetical protein